MNDVMELLPEGSQSDVRRAFLKNYIEALADYSLIAYMGKAVSQMLDEGTAREEINYDSVKEHLTGGAEKIPGDISDPDYEGWDYYFSE